MDDFQLQRLSTSKEITWGLYFLQNVRFNFWLCQIFSLVGCFSWLTYSCQLFTCCFSSVCHQHNQLEDWFSFCGSISYKCDNYHILWLMILRILWQSFKIYCLYSLTLTCCYCFVSENPSVGAWRCCSVYTFGGYWLIIDITWVVCAALMIRLRQSRAGGNSRDTLLLNRNPR
jgi:hypothetical protein